MDWIDAQVAGAVQFCATPGQMPLPSNAFTSKLEMLFRSQEYGGDLPFILQSVGRIGKARHAPLNISLRGLVRLCALLGISLRQMLESANQGIAENAFDFYAGHLCLPMPIDEEHERAASALALVRRILARCLAFYLPPLAIVVRPISINRALMRELDVELYERYESQYRAQATPTGLLRLERAFQKTLSFLSDLPPERLRHRLLWSVPDQIAKRARVNSDEATRAFQAALVYSRLSYLTKRNHAPRDERKDAACMRIWPHRPEARVNKGRAV